jgi:aryl-alcohol dehydrogenase-like predicted oxidoreductase
VVLATKVYGNMREGEHPQPGAGISAYKVRKHAADSLRRLQTDHIDLYQVHHFVRGISAEEFWGTFERLVDDGKCCIWARATSPAGAWPSSSCRPGSAGGGAGLRADQYNLLNRYPRAGSAARRAGLGIGVLAYMPLAGGLLTGKTQAEEARARARSRNEYGIRLGEQNQQLADFSALCRELGEPEHIVAIAWTLMHPAVIRPLSASAPWRTWTASSAPPSWCSRPK